MVFCYQKYLITSRQTYHRHLPLDRQVSVGQGQDRSADLQGQRSAGRLLQLEQEGRGHQRRKVGRKVRGHFENGRQVTAKISSKNVCFVILIDMFDGSVFDTLVI